MASASSASSPGGARRVGAPVSGAAAAGAAGPVDAETARSVPAGASVSCTPPSTSTSICSSEGT
eukprot:8955116-Lingulodinium_polyedra.AAC.1